MAEYSFKLPDLGEGTVESEIVLWRAAVGAHIEADQPLVDVMTDKATIEITAPVSGTLLSVAGEPGDMVAVGSELAVFVTDSEHVPVTGYRPVPGRHDEEEVGDTSSPGPAAGRPQTSPAVRRLVREKGIDLGRVHGTGPNGRVTRADVDLYLRQQERQTPAGDDTGTTGVHAIKLAGLRRKIAEQMTRSAGSIPHFSYVEEADVTELERLRSHLTNLPGADSDTRRAPAGGAPGKEHISETRQEDQPKLTYLPFFMLALVRVIREFPRCNAHFDAERQVIRQFDPVHIGIAVQTQDGLMVPVIRHVETLDLWQCAHELGQVAERTRAGRARREELSGSTITITSLGALGGIVSTPIINYPEVAIIGINRTQQRPVLEGGVVSNRLVMNISSSFDHRVIDGHEAARAIHALKRYLEFPTTLFLPA